MFYNTLHNYTTDTKTIKTIKPPLNHTIKYTTYYPDAGSESPTFITASGLILNDDIAKRCNIIALSRDIIHKYKLEYGDTLDVKLKTGYIHKFIYHDKMNVRYRNRIDILKPTNSKIKNGIGSIVKIKKRDIA